MNQTLYLIDSGEMTARKGCYVVNAAYILQAADVVHLTVVLCDLAYVSSEQAVLHSSDPSAVDLSVPQADRPTLSCTNQAGGYQSGDKSCRSAF